MDARCVCVRCMWTGIDIAPAVSGEEKGEKRSGGKGSRAASWPPAASSWEGKKAAGTGGPAAAWEEIGGLWVVGEKPAGGW